MTQPARSRLPAIVKGTLQAAAALAIIGYLVWSNWNRIGSAIQGRSVRWDWLAGGFAMCLAAVLVTFLRWYLLVWAQGLPFRIRDSLRIGFIGYFFNLLIPGAVGGDLVKAVLLAREQQRKTVAIATVLIDRIIGLYGLILLGGLATAIFWSDVRRLPALERLGIFSLALMAGSTVALVILFSLAVQHGRLADWLSRFPAVGSMLREAIGSMAVYRSKWRVLILTTLLSVAGHVGFVLALRCGMAAVAPALPPARVHFMIVPLGLMVGAVPLTPGGAGPTEAVMQWLFDSVQQDGAMALLMMLAFRATQVLVAIVGMIYYLASRRETRQALSEATANS
jgi:uncharacterized protein (TIRG00374 family)